MTRTSSIVSFADDGKVEVLLSERGSAVELETVAVFVTCENVLSARSKTALMLFPSTPGKMPIVQVMVPMPPVAGVVQSKCGPDVCVHAAKVLPAGTESVSVRPAASLGPALATVMTDVSPPAEAALVEPSTESMERSADAVDVAAIPVAAVLELSEVFGSGVAELIVAVLLMMPDGAPGDVFTEIVKLVSASFSNAAAVQVIVPPDPIGGVVHVKSVVDAFSARKVVPAGSVSVTVTFCADEGPPLETKIE